MKAATYSIRLGQQKQPKNKIGYLDTQEILYYFHSICNSYKLLFHCPSATEISGQNMAIAFFPSSNLYQRLVTPINPHITNPSNFRLTLNTPSRVRKFSAAEGHKPKTVLRWKLFSTNSDDSPKETSTDEYDLGVKAALGVLRFYKSEISPILPRSCRFVPTCSEYSMIAYRKYGFAKGTVLTAWRICRCNPISGGSGFDPPRWFDEKRPTED